jgi:hypothetical protein
MSEEKDMLKKFKDYNLNCSKGMIIGEALLTDCILVTKEFEEELYKHFDKISLGYAEDEIADPKDMEQYYPQDKQEKYGVLGIEIKVLE